MEDGSWPSVHSGISGAGRLTALATPAKKGSDLPLKPQTKTFQALILNESGFFYGKAKRGNSDRIVESCFMKIRYTQEDAPLLEGLINYSHRGVAPFHTPGHRGGKGAHALLQKLGGQLLALDLTELKGLNLGRDPDFLLRSAEELAAEAFGAKRTFFLVSGASIGIMAGLLSLGASGREVLVARDCHLSVINGLILSGIKPVFISPCWVGGFPVLPSPAKVEEALAKTPNAAALLVTNPGYHGIYGPVEKLAEITRQAGIPLVVDEAHGGHLSYLSPEPVGAGPLGADLWVWGVHKMMGSLTQTGMLHLNSDLLQAEAIRAALELLGTTSPSYILLASLDAARHQLYHHGREMFSKAAGFGELIREGIRNIDNIRVLSPQELPPGYGLDPTKVAISLRSAGLTGIEAEEILFRRYRIQPEYADSDYLYFFISYAQQEKEIEDLIAACHALAKGRVAVNAGPSKTARRAEDPENRKGDPSSAGNNSRLGPPPWADQAPPVSPREAFFSASEEVTLAEAAHRLAADTVAAYPPGVPLWIPGEMITTEMVEWAQGLQRIGGFVKGIKDGKVRALR